MTIVPTSTMSGAEMVELCKRHTIYEWSAQAAIDPIPVARAEGVYFWTPEGKRYLDFNSQLMCTNIGHGHPSVVLAIQEQAATLAYANPFMATEVRARLGAHLATSTTSSSPTGAPRRTRTPSASHAPSPGGRKCWRGIAPIMEPRRAPSR
jgi:4-aminobutyrate aminotransferase-like enzyme